MSTTLVETVDRLDTSPTVAFTAPTEVSATSQPVIPTIDISPYLQDPKSAEAAHVVEAVRDACTTKGFFQVVGHGMTPEMQREAFDASKAFFALPLAVKEQIDRSDHRFAGRGYENFKSQIQVQGGEGDNKEGFYMSCEIPSDASQIQKFPYQQAPNQWLSSEIISDAVFKEPMIRYHTAMIEVSRQLIDIMAAGLNVPLSFFDDFYNDYPVALLSPKHYPPIPEDTDLMAIGCGPHTDFGAVTFLLQDGVSGLEIKDGDDWVQVPPVDNAYVVNIGDMFQKWTRGFYKSTIHRVIPPRKNHRYSIPFFWDGNPGFRLVPFDGEREGDKVQTVAEHLQERFLKLTGQA